MTQNVENAEKIRQQNPVPAGHKVLPVCYLCNKVPKEGIKSGFFLKGIFICEECEKELINIKPEKHDEYMLTIAKLRHILFKNKSI
ncbi:MAG: Inhibitor of sigma-G Gin [Peptococcaceae bacterium]|jgi:hypothetical protein|nr:Inhibitor of sigma-G Gin [Peptococcaceae bacterium]